jgi:cytochrome P450/NADPH-cytochrome P450 reductase
MLCKSHLDPTVYGDDATEFKPERMLDDNFAKLNEEFPNSWKPFGNGKRACIGRPFAWQEAMLAMAMLFQNFNFTLEDPNYNLTIQETLTIKPKGFQMRATLRHDMTPTELEQRLAGSGTAAAKSQTKHAAPEPATGTGKGKPMAVFYGSNSGTCEALAQRLASDAPAHGFSVSEVSPLDTANQNLPKDRPVVIVTASYEGQPPSNAALFVDWLENLKGKELENVVYAVFGCGHHDWVETFHRIPKLVDATMQERGAERIVPLACADAAKSDMFSDFETWEDDTLWPALKEKYGAGGDSATSGVSGITVEVTNPRKSTLRQDVEEAVVVTTKTLCQTGSIKKHIEIQLPTGMTYKAGDYLAVLPFNPKKTVARVFRRFQLSWDAALKIHSEGPTTLPTDATVSAADVLGAYVELSQPATKRVGLI